MNILKIKQISVVDQKYEQFKHAILSKDWPGESKPPGGGDGEPIRCESHDGTHGAEKAKCAGNY